MAHTTMMVHHSHCIPINSDEGPAPDERNLSPALREAIVMVEHCIDSLNAALRQAVDAGATVELRRRGRVHSGDGCWADQMAQLVLPKSIR